MSPRGPVLVGAIGNRDRGDDAAGPVVLDRLADRRRAGVDLVELGADAERILDALCGRRLVYFVDAVCIDRRLGTVLRVEADLHPLPAEWSAPSTHALGLAEAIELARTMGALPPSVIVYGIVASRFDFGAPLQPRVRVACEWTARWIAQQLDVSPDRLGLRPTRLEPETDIDP